MWISVHKDNKFIVIVLTVNIAEKFYTNLNPLFDNKSLRICVKNDAFKEFHKAINYEVNLILQHTAQNLNV